MKRKVFSVYDVAVGAYNNPFYAVTTAEGERYFMSALDDPNTMLRKHPTDYVLYEVGTFDDYTAKFENHEPIKPLGTALEFISRSMEARGPSEQIDLEDQQS